MMLLALLPAALATDLDVSFTVPIPGRAPVAVTFRDVQPGDLPAVSVPGTDGQSYRFLLNLSRNVDETYTLAVTVDAVLAERGGHQATKWLASPRITFHADEAVEFAKGGEGRALGLTAKLQDDPAG